jgi:allantoinase
MQAKAKVNVGFWGGITPENAHKEDVLWGMLKAGALGFKSFVAPSGINDFANVSRSDVAGAMHFLLSKGAPFFVHAELVTEVEQTEVRRLQDSNLWLLVTPVRPLITQQILLACWSG